MGQITATRNLVAIKVVRHAGQLLGQAIQHDSRSRPMGHPALAKWEHDKTENMQILC